MMLGHFGDINFTRRGRRVLTDTKCRTGDRDATMYLNDTPGGRRSTANAWLRGRTLPPSCRRSVATITCRNADELHGSICAEGLVPAIRRLSPTMALE